VVIVEYSRKRHRQRNGEVSSDHAARMAMKCLRVGRGS
jgi:hypothetical protein